MEWTESSPPTVQTVLAMLKSRNAGKVQQAEAIFTKIGPKAAELLLIEARTTRCSTKYRLQCLRLADDIGIIFNHSTSGLLQQLIEVQQREIAEEASRILVEITPPGPIANVVLPFIARGPHGIRDRLQRLKSERSSVPPQSGNGRKHTRHCGQHMEAVPPGNCRDRKADTVQDNLAPDLRSPAPEGKPE